MKSTTRADMVSHMLHELVLSPFGASAFFQHEEANSTPRNAGFHHVLAFIVLSGTLLGTPIAASSIDAPRLVMTQEIAGNDSTLERSGLILLVEDATAVSPETIALARMILGNLPVEVRVPHVAPSADGEVGFTWVNGRDRLEAMLHPDKHLVWIKKISGNFALGEDIEISAPEDLSVFYSALGNFYERS
jgi:hypothetical protein